MPRRKERVPVVFDTNLIIAFHLSTNPESANSKVYRLWRNERRLQLVVSDETVGEYLEILARLGVATSRIERLKERLERRETVTRVNLGTRPKASRDPDDNLILAAAIAGQVKFLITNDRDLLDIPAGQKRKFKFSIVSPVEVLIRLEDQS